MSNHTCSHCDHCHTKESEAEEKLNKKHIILYSISIIIFVLTFIPILENYKIWSYLLIILLSGYELIIEGIKNIFKLNFEEDTLMTIAVIAAFCLGEFPESCMVVLLFRLGEFLEEKAVENSNTNIKNIVEVKAKTANIIDEKEEIKIVDIEEAKVGEKIIIKPGEMVPLDCKILKGTANLDMSSLTGESMPISVKENEEILSGGINLNRQFNM